MRAVSNYKTKRKPTDVVFFIYFTLMALLYTKTYIQLAAQLSILAYVAYDVFFRRGMGTMRAGFRNVRFLALWFGLFSAWAMLSTNWAYSKMFGSNTVLTLFRIFVIGVALFLYVADYNRAVSVMKAFIYSNVIMAIAALLTTPLSQYGKSGEEGFGTLIGQQRNTFGAVMTFSIIICIVFYRYERFRHGKPLAAFFAIALLCSGSRGAMLQLVIVASIYIITRPGIIKKFKNILAVALIAVIVAFLLQNIPFLKETVWDRFADAIYTVTGIEEDADGSARGRGLYKVLAYEMFEERPILGYGVDGFYCMLRDVEVVNGYHLEPKYSHCNYTEIMADFGLVGLLIWYLPLFIAVLKIYKSRQKNPIMDMIFCLITSMIILDYARIPWSNHMGMYPYFCLIALYLALESRLKAQMREFRFNALLSEEDI